MTNDRKWVREENIKPKRATPAVNNQWPENGRVSFRNKEWTIETSGQTTLKLSREDEVEVVVIGEEKIKLL